MGSERRREVAEAVQAVESADGLLEEIDAIRRLREAAERAEQAAVRSARDNGISWRRIGALYGLTKQGAQQRFAEKKSGERS